MKVLSTGNFDHFWKLAITASLVVAASLPTWNYFLDPYQVFAGLGDCVKEYTSPTTNERYLKVAFLISRQHPSKVQDYATLPLEDLSHNKSLGNRHRYQIAKAYDSVIVGSSAMGVVDPVLLDRHYPGRRFYNLSFLAAKPDEILSSLKALRRGGMPIRQVVYGLEPMAFTDAHDYGSAQQLHPDASGISHARFVMDALFAPSLFDGLMQLASMFDQVPSVRYDIKGGGRYYLGRYDNEILADYATYAAVHFHDAPAIAPPWIESRFEDFGSLMAWLRSERIPVMVYLNPLHPVVAKTYGAGRLVGFRQRLSGLASGLKPNDCTGLLGGDGAGLNFYDFKHFRPQMALSVLGCGLGTNKSRI